MADGDVTGCQSLLSKDFNDGIDMVKLSENPFTALFGDICTAKKVLCRNQSEDGGNREKCGKNEGTVGETRELWEK